MWTFSLLVWITIVSAIPLLLGTTIVGTFSSPLKIITATTSATISDNYFGKILFLPLVYEHLCCECELLLWVHFRYYLEQLLWVHHHHHFRRSLPLLFHCYSKQLLQREYYFRYYDFELDKQLLFPHLVYWTVMK